MELISPIATLIAIIVAIFSIPKTLHAIGEYKRKKFKDELENFNEYFDNFYKADETKYPLLLRDKAAQNISRSIDMNSELLHYLIELHEKGLANFDQIRDQYYWGSRFIKVQKDEELLIFSKKSKISYPKSKFYYSVYAICLTVAIFVFSGKLNFWNVQWLDALIGVSFVIFSISALRRGDDMKEALDFLEIMKTAQHRIDVNEKSNVEASIDLAS